MINNQLRRVLERSQYYIEEHMTCVHHTDMQSLVELDELFDEIERYLKGDGPMTGGTGGRDGFRMM